MIRVESLPDGRRIIGGVLYQKRGDKEPYLLGRELIYAGERQKIANFLNEARQLIDDAENSLDSGSFIRSGAHLMRAVTALRKAMTIVDYGWKRKYPGGTLSWRRMRD